MSGAIRSLLASDSINSVTLSTLRGSELNLNDVLASLMRVVALPPTSFCSTINFQSVCVEKYNVHDSFLSQKTFRTAWI